MKSFGNQFRLRSGFVEYFLLLELGINTGAGATTLLTDYPLGITANGKTYTYDGGLATIEPPKISTTVDREVYKISLLDNDGQLFNKNATDTNRLDNVIGASIITYMGLFDYDSNDVRTPNTSNLLTVYEGAIDGIQVVNDFEEKVVVIEGSSPMADLSMIQIRMTNKDYQSQLSAADTAFDYVLEDVEDVKLKWGKVD